MAWATENRTLPIINATNGPLLTDEMKSHLRETYFGTMNLPVKATSIDRHKYAG